MSTRHPDHEGWTAELCLWCDGPVHQDEYDYHEEAICSDECAGWLTRQRKAEQDIDRDRL